MRIFANFVEIGFVLICGAWAYAYFAQKTFFTCMSEKLENNRRIAKNTLFLYFRMLLTMGISLYTVRVVLEVLGVVDYGLYNVVGGIVVTLSFFNQTMSAASQRFFAYELGRNNIAQLGKTFSMTLTIYFIIAAVILLLAETIGLWFLQSKMTIPPDRMDAAKWVYQFSIMSFIMSMFTVPYNSMIIAHEDMKIYAYISIVESILKLMIVFLLVYFSYDKLKLYGVLMFSVTVIIAGFYWIYSSRKYKEFSYKFYWNKSLFKEIISYSGWNLVGVSAGIFKDQGINILLNVFFNPVVNASRGIAFQVNNSINQFATNFIKATQPQITKHYATGETDQMLKLVFKSSKFSFFLLLILSMPVLLETNSILTVWLKKTPEFVVLFSRLVIVNALIDSLSYPLVSAAMATGKIRRYQLTVGGMQMLNIPVSYLLLSLDMPPETPMYVAICIAIINLLLRLFLLRKMVGLNVAHYINNVLIIVLLTAAAAYVLPLSVVCFLDESIIRFIVVCMVGGIMSVLSVYFIGSTKGEQSFYIKAADEWIYKKTGKHLIK